MHVVPRMAAALFLAIALAGTAARAETPAAPEAAATPAAPKVQQYVYVLRVAPRLHDAAQWTPADNDAVSRHFDRLSAATKAGQVIFAGRTSEPLDTTFGLVVFEAATAEAARQFMDADPAVVAGVMTAELHPYALVLQRKP